MRFFMLFLDISRKLFKISKNILYKNFIIIYLFNYINKIPFKDFEKKFLLLFFQNLINVIK